MYSQIVEIFFPDICIVPDFISLNCINPLLKKENEQIDFFAAKGKVLYRSIVKVTNIKWLKIGVILYGEIC